MPQVKSISLKIYDLKFLDVFKPGINLIPCRLRKIKRQEKATINQRSQDALYVSFNQVSQEFYSASRLNKIYFFLLKYNKIYFLKHYTEKLKSTCDYSIS